MFGFQKNAICAGFALINLAMTGVAFASSSSSEVRSAHTDQSGNAILITRGGAKIIVIVIGEGERLSQAFDAPKIVKAEENCRSVGIVVRGRSYMYGVSSGDAIPFLEKIICD